LILICLAAFRISILLLYSNSINLWVTISPIVLILYSRNEFLFVPRASNFELRFPGLSKLNNRSIQWVADPSAWVSRLLFDLSLNLVSQLRSPKEPTNRMFV